MVLSAWRQLVRAAKYDRGPFYRELALRAAALHIANGKPLPEPLVQWLLFVFGELLRHDAIPRIADKRRQADPVEEIGKALQLYVFLAERPRKAVLVALDEASNALEFAARKVYFDARFKPWRDRLKRERRGRAKRKSTRLKSRTTG
jgi:hypothetical protein